MYENAIDCFTFLTIASVCMGIFRAKFLSETWSVLIQENCREKCAHGTDCVCEWIEGRLGNSSSQLEKYCGMENGNLDPSSTLLKRSL